MSPAFWVPAFLVSLFASIVGLQAWIDAREWGGIPWWRRRRILREGKAATALIKDEMTQPSKSSSRRIVAFASTLILEVRPPGGAAYEAVSRMHRTMGEGLYVGPGKVVPVRIATTGEVVVDLDAARTEREGAQGSRNDAFLARAREIEERNRRR
ncbi:MAG: hypothetical protein U0234_16050 [Sandaracinus sp.]